MPMKQRHSMIALGDVAAGASTPEADLSSANWAFVYGTTTAASTSFKVEATPVPFGTTPTSSEWYQYGATATVSLDDENFCIAIPFEGFWDYVTPQRIRIKVTSAGSTGLDDVYIEGVREIG